MKVLFILLVFPFLVSCAPCSLYRVTDYCLKCLKSLRYYDERDLVEIQNREYVTLEYVLSFANVKTRLRNLDAQSSTVHCLNSYGEQAPQETTQNRIERQLQERLQDYHTECSDRIANMFTRDKTNWNIQLCTAYHNKDVSCFPLHSIDDEEKKYFNIGCLKEIVDRQ